MGNVGAMGAAGTGREHRDVSTVDVRVGAAARLILVPLAIALVLVVTAPSASRVEAAIISPFSPSASQSMAPGIDFAKGTMRTSGGRRQSVRVATVDARHPAVSLRSLLSNDRVIRKERPSRLARRKSRPGRTAMVATNGDRSVFGRVDAYAAPHSMHVSGGELMVAQACTRPTLGIDRSGVGRIDEVRAHLTAVRVGHQAVKQIHRVNTHRDDGKVVLYTRRFGPSTQTRQGGTEVVLDLADTLRPSAAQTVRVLRVRRGGGDTRLREGQAVLSVRGTNGKWVRQLRAGHRLRLRTAVVRRVDRPCGGTIRAADGWRDVEEAMGGNHYTARNGSVRAPSARAYPAGSQRHPRTNVGVTADGRVLMVTVDGRQPGYSIGVTLAEMGELLISLGARHAFNLDGGGSTVMAKRMLRSGRFVVHNRPSDGRERVHSQALAAFALGG